MSGRAADYESAVAFYQAFVEDYPDSDEAPAAAWWLAALTAELGDVEPAIEHYVFLADSFPEHKDAPEALYRAGKLAAENEDLESAYALWLRAVEEYPTTLYGSTSLLEAVLAESEPGDQRAASAANLARTPPTALTRRCARETWSQASSHSPKSHHLPYRLTRARSRKRPKTGWSNSSTSIEPCER